MNQEAKSIKKCERCGVIIRDETWLCPLCSGAITSERADVTGTPHSVSYPDISYRIKKMRLAIKITVFVSVVAAVIMFIINYFTFNGIYWSLMATAGLAYACMTLIFSFRKKSSTQWIIIIQCILAAGLIYVLDWILGYSGWSVRYGFPVLVMLADLIAVILMCVYRNGWQNFIITEIVACAFGLVLLLMSAAGMGEVPVLTAVAAAGSALILAGTILFGHRMIREEVKRRFRV